MFTIDIPKLTLSGIDWWEIVNGKSLIAKEAMYWKMAICEVYLDRSLPFRKIKTEQFSAPGFNENAIAFFYCKNENAPCKIILYRI